MNNYNGVSLEYLFIAVNRVDTATGKLCLRAYYIKGFRALYIGQKH